MTETFAPDCSPCVRGKWLTGRCTMEAPRALIFISSSGEISAASPRSSSPSSSLRSISLYAQSTSRTLTPSRSLVAWVHSHALTLRMAGSARPGRNPMTASARSAAASARNHGTCAARNCPSESVRNSHAESVRPRAVAIPVRTAAPYPRLTG
jgi:hypothetical protein